MLLRLICTLSCLTSFVNAKNVHSDDSGQIFHEKTYLEKAQKDRVWEDQIQKIPPPDLRWIEQSKRSISDIRNRVHEYGYFAHDYNKVRKLSERFNRSQLVGLSRKNIDKSRGVNYIPFDDVRTLRHV